MIRESYLIAQQHVNKRIGNQLTTIVMNYLWHTEHYALVTKPLIQYNIKAGKMHLFLKNRILPIIRTIHFKQNEHYLIYLKYYNSFLREVANNNGLRIYLMNHYPYMKHITPFITHHRFVGVNPSYIYICNYCLTLSKSMRYHVITNFKQLNDISGNSSDIFTGAGESVNHIYDKYT